MLSRFVKRCTTIGRTQARTFATAPHGGTLVNCLYTGESLNALKSESNELPDVVLSKRQLCDIELLLNGGFSPLDGFMNKADYDSVCQDMRLKNGLLFPMPITFDINDEQRKIIENSGKTSVTLRDWEGNAIAVMDMNDIWQPDKLKEARCVFGGDLEHPAIDYLLREAGDTYVGGKLRGIQLPPQYDYQDIRKTPAETRAMFEKKGWDKVVAFQTRNPMHRAHFELTQMALASDPDMKLMVHPVVGQTKPGDIDHHTRVKCYKRIMPKYEKGRADLCALPLAMRMGGPREAVWHTIIRKNYGATHFIVGRDHAGPGSNSAGRDFYGPYEARDLGVKCGEELGMNMLSFEMMVFAPDDNKYYPVNQVPDGLRTLKLSGTEVRRRLKTGEDIPTWFSFPEVVDILRVAHPPRHKQGFCVFMTGLSGSGKTTVANALQEKLMEIQDRSVTMLDGDHVRQLLSKGLTFSREDRLLNIKRIGFVASEVVKAGGIVLACPIAPHEESRVWARQAVQKTGGGFMMCHISTSFEDCEKRDRKGLYKKAREGLLKGLTGLDDPYETPEQVEMIIDCGENATSVADAVQKIIDQLTSDFYLKGVGEESFN
jgi:sulfate adenylyltransferase